MSSWYSDFKLTPEKPASRVSLPKVSNFARHIFPLMRSKYSHNDDDNNDDDISRYIENEKQRYERQEYERQQQQCKFTEREREIAREERERNERERLRHQYEQDIKRLESNLKNERKRREQYEQQCEQDIKSLDLTCIICMEKAKNTIMIPCNHVCCCVECSKYLKKCPMCRTQLEDIKRVYI